MVSAAFKNRTRDEIIAAVHESIRMNHGTGPCLTIFRVNTRQYHLTH